MKSINSSSWGRVCLATPIFVFLLIFLGGSLSGQTISFNSSGLSGESLNNPTSLQFGPDDRLYVSQQNGFIYAYTITRNGPNDYAVTATEQIDEIRTIVNHNEDGSVFNSNNRQVTGILVEGTATNPILYVTSSDPRIGGGGSGNSTGLDENSGVISRLTWNGTAWDMVHLVRGLPRSEENHSLNGLQLDKTANILYVAAGGHTNKGAPSNNFAYLPEFAYSTAILSVDLTVIDAMPTQTDSDGQLFKYDLPTLDDEDRANVTGAQAGYEDPNDPWGGNDGKNQAMLVVGGPVQVYSSGWRNHYDVLLTTNGRLYTFDNGPNTGWGGIPAAGCTNAANEANSNTTCDNLHFVSGPGYYGGHPNPTRANRANTFNVTNPQTPIPAGMEDQFCDYRNPGTQDGALATVCSSTNGLCEYTATNFNGALQGNLLAAAFNGNIFRFALNAAGDSVITQQSLFSGFGSTPLDVIALGDAAPFPGTVWACTYGSDNITIFEPNDFVFCVGNDTSFTNDSDGDGYSNGDELANGSDQCSPASIPADWDGDFLSDIIDNDDDNDGILDNVDLFARDPDNGHSTTLPINYQFDNSIDPGINGWGFTGLMTNYTDDYMDLFDPGDMTVGGAALKFTVDSVPPGDALGSLNNQEYAFQFGVDVGGEINDYTINGRIQGHFANQIPIDFQSYGIHMGTGDQDNYLKLTLASNGGAGGIEVVYEENGGGVGGIGAPVSTMYPVTGLLNSTFIDLYFTVNPNNNTVQPKYSIDGSPVQTLGSPIAVPNSWINHVLSVGLIMTSRGATTSYPATYDFITITREPLTATGQWYDIIPTSGSASNRHENSWCQVGDKWYLVGGRGNRPVDIFDPATNTWTNGAQPPFQMHHFQGIEYEGNLWIIGAFTGGFPNETPISNIWIYNPTTDAWHEGPEIPANRRRGSAGVVVYNDEIYLVCGIQNGHVNGWVPWVDKYDPSTGTWTQLADAPIERDHYHAAVHDGKIYNMGGRRTGFGGSTFNPTVAQVDVYDIASNSWQQLPATSNIPTERAGCFTGVIGDEVIVAGGESGSQGAGHEETEAFNVYTQSWRTLANMIDGRHGTSMLVNNGVLYVAAGSGNRGGGPELNTIEAFAFNGLRPAVDGYALQASALTGNPANHDFGTVTAPQTASQIFTISNSGGNQGMFITSVDIVGASVFTHNFAGNLPYYLGPGETLDIEVTFAPTAATGYTGNLVLGNTGSAPLSIPLTAGGAIDLALYRINANGPSYTDVGGRTFSADAFFTGGQGTNNSGLGIAGTTDDALYQLYRYGQFSYDFPVPQAGDYQIILHFSENWTGANGAGLRVFDVEAEGNVIIDDLDIWATAGFQTAYIDTIVVNVTDGTLNLDWIAGVQNPKVAAIEVLGPLNPSPAALVITPDPLHFFSQTVNTTSASQDLNLANSGAPDSTLTINSVVIGGPHSGDFAFTASLPQTLNGGSSLDIPFTFTPTATGLRTAFIVVTHSGTTSPDTVSLTGEGVQPQLSASITVNASIVCAGDLTGSLTATATNGQMPMTFAWSNGGNTATINNLGVGTYTVTITDANNQTATDSYTFSVNALSAAVSSCLENGQGVASVVGSGGMMPYTYAWSTGGTTDSIFGLANGNYTVTITDANGCTASGSALIDANTPVCDTCALPAGWAAQDIGNVAAVGKSCYNAAQDIWYVDGSGVDIWNANDEFQYAYTTLAGDGEIIARVTSITNTNQWAKAGVMMRDNLDPDSKHLMMLKRGANGLSFQWRTNDGGNAQFTGGQSIPTFPVYLRLVRSGNSFTAFHSADGISWTQLGAAQNITMANTIYVGLAVTSHNDGVINNSIFDNVQIITPSAPVQVTASIANDISCAGAVDGSATASASQGQMPYTYAWSNGQTGATATGLAAGTYTVTVTDANNTTATASVTLVDPAAVVASASVTTAPVCVGDAGSATASATNGTAPYTFQWDANAANQTTATASNLVAGTYSVTVTDANGCSGTASVTIVDPAPVVAAATITTAPACVGDAGSATASGSNGIAPYTFQWDANAANQTTATASNLVAGTYSVTVTDANGCFGTASVTIVDPAPVVAAASVTTAPVCAGDAGSATASASGGTAPYTFQWDANAANQTTATASNLVAGTYSVTVSDANGCTATASVTIVDPAPVVASATVTGLPGCVGGTGSATAAAIGGTAPYTFLWDAAAGNQTTATATNLNAGTYSVTITDANGCTANASVTLSAPTALGLTFTTSSFNCGEISCAGETDGSITANVTGGTPPYSFDWGGNAIRLNAGNQGAYTALSGDVFAADNFVTGGSFFNVGGNIANTPDPDLYKSERYGNLTYNVPVSNGNYTVRLHFAEIFGGAQSVGARLFDVDIEGVQVLDDYDIFATVGFRTAVVESFNTTVSDGSLDIVFTTVVDNAKISAIEIIAADGNSLSGLGAGTYAVTVTDSNGCTMTDSVTLTEPTPLVANTASQDESCPGANDGSASASASGGCAPYTFAWSNSSSTSSASGLAAGTYSVTITDANGCTTVDSVTIAAGTGVSASVSMDNDVSCNGGNDGQASASVTSGTAPYTYQWDANAGNQTSATASSLAAGTYSVVITDANGCSATASVTIAEPTAIAFSTSSVDVSCNGGADGSASVSVSGGTAPYSYAWSGNGGTGSTASNLAAGTYSVMITDVNNCVASASVTVGEPSPLAVNFTTSQYNCGYEISCNGAADGSISASVSGGTGPYVTSWGSGTAIRINTGNGGSFTTVGGQTFAPDNFFTGLATPFNTYTNNNIQDITGTLDDQMYRTERYGQNFRYDFPVPNGQYQVVLHFAEIYHGATNTPSQPGNIGDRIFNVDIEGSAFLTNFDIFAEVGTMTALIKQTAVTVNDGLLSIEFSTVVDNAKISAIEIVELGGNGNSLSNLVAGTYQFNVTDANGCTTTQSVTLTEPDPLVANTQIAQGVSCNGGSDGIAAVNMTGGCAPYTYAWSDGQTTASASNLSAGSYFVTITDANGCSTSDSVSLSEPTALSVSASVTNPISAVGGNDGELTANANGGTAPYTFAWSGNGGNQAVAPNLSAGTYTVTMTDANGCTGTATIQLDDPVNPLTLSVNQTNSLLCAGDANASAEAIVGGGIAPYTFIWSNGNTTAVASGLAAGSYSVTVTDAQNNSIVGSITISEPAAIQVSASATDALCNGDNSGSAQASATGGTAPYSFAWSNGSTSANASSLSAGTYTVTITDANNCTETATVIVGEPAAIQVSASATDALCNGDNSGSAQASAIGGTAPYSFSWSNGSTSASASNLTAGTYTVTITDANNCTETATVTVNEPSAIQLSASATDALCNGDNSGSAQASATGGTAPYSFAWSNGSTSASASNLTAGTYTVTITDANNCTETATVTVNEPPAIQLSATATDALCNGDNSGSAQASATGGTAPYSFSWSNGATSASAPNLVAGTYTVTVTDANNCTETTAVTVDEPLPIQIAATITDALCNGDTNGTIALAVSGGTGAYTYAWNNGATTPNLQNLGAGSYSVTVTDANNCTETSTHVVNEPPVLGGTIASTDVTCNGQGDGAMDLTVTGGTTPYTYLWSNGATTQDIDSLDGGIYFVTVTDGNGCDAEVVGFVAEPAPILISWSVTPIACAGDSSGTLIVVPFDGTKFYEYAWSTGDSTQAITGISAGTYTVTVIDPLSGCVIVVDTTLADPNPLALSFNSSDVTCFGQADGSASAVASGGSGALSYLWSNGATTASLSGLQPGTYSVTVTDTSACTISGSVSIGSPTQLVAQASVINNAGCNVAGEADVTISGGTAPYSILWSDGQTTAVASNLAAGTYTVSITDANNCTATASVTITGTTSGTIALSGNDISCTGANDGSITASGGSAPYTFSIGPVPTSIVNQIGFGADDAEEDQTGFVRRGNAELEVVYDNPTRGNQIIGLRFRNFNVPQGATILKAHLQFTSFNTNNVNPASFLIEGEDVDNAALFVNGANNDLSNRTRTTANVAWSPADWTAAGQAGPDQETPDLSTIVQEIVNRPGYNANNQMAFFLSGIGRRSAAAFNSNAANAPILTIEYTTGPTNLTNGNLPAGTYLVSVTDGGGCTGTDTITIAEPTLLTASASGTDVTCAGGNDGTASAAAGGGTAPYTYAWNNGGTSASLSGLTAGSYTVTITDANGCAATVNVFLGEPAPIVVSTTDATCFGEASGSLAANGGTGPYTWNIASVNPLSFSEQIGFGRDDAEQWSNGNVSLGNNDLELVYDGPNRGNQIVGLMWRDVSIPAGATINSAYIQFTAKNTGNQNPINLTISGLDDGNAPLFQNATNDLSTRAKTSSNVSWAPANWTAAGQAGADQRTPDLSTIVQEIVNGNNWQSGNRLGVLIEGQGRRRALSFNGSRVDAAVLVVQYSLNSLTDPSALAAGDYLVTVTDANGCTVTTQANIAQPAEIIATASQTLAASSSSANDGEATVSATGGTPPYTYQWNNAAGGQTTATASNLGAGVYFVDVTDANGCSATDTVAISVTVNPLVASASVTQTILCAGDATGAATVSASGGTPGYTYQWDNNAGNQTTATAVGLAAGTYSVTVSDAGNGQVVVSVTLTEPSPLAFATTDVLCAGDATGSISATGGTAPYTVSIQGQSGTVSLQPGASNDDVEQTLTSGAMNLNSPSLEIGWDNNNSADPQAIGIRFPGVNIPQGAVITGATLTFTALSNASGAASFDFVAEASDDAASYTSANNNVDGRPSTTASVNWVPGNWSTNQTYTTPDVSSLIQEVVNRGGWQSGNALAIKITGSGFREADGFDSNPADAPTLVVSYSLSSNANALTAGTYNATVVDANGCTLTGSVTISEPAPLSLTGTTVGCGATGQIYAGGGTAPYNLTLQSGGQVAVRVAQGSDDVEETQSSGAINNNSPSLEIGWDNNNPSDPQTVGMRFEGIAIPQGATITSASIDFNALSNQSSAASFNFYGEDVDDASPLTAANSDLANRTATTANVAWNNVPAWSTSQVYGSPDLSSIVQEIVDRNGWVTGNDMVFMVDGTGLREARSYNNSSSQAPLLNVTWTLNPITATDTLSGLQPADYLVTVVDANGCTFTDSVAVGSSCNPCATQRVANGLIAYYPFVEGSGNVVHDLSGYGDPLHLSILEPSKVSWLPGSGISVNANTIIPAKTPADKIIDACSQTNEITVEAWVVPASLNQNGPSRIVTFSTDPFERNWTLGQQNGTYMARLRTSTSQTNGTPDLSTGNDVNTALQHVVMTRAANGDWNIYVDGVVEANGNRGGNLSNWDNRFDFALVNELTNNRPWLGEIYQVAVYDVALTPAEIQQNLITGAGCGGNYPPVAYCAAEPRPCEDAQTVDFDASGSVDADGQIVSYFWDFGDGNSAAGATPTHNYVNPGQYTATLIVVDDQGAADTCMTVVNATPNLNGRVNTDLIALYTFTEGTGSTVFDYSGFGAPLDLTIQDPNNITWNPNGSLTINSGTMIRSGVAATKVTNACQASNEITVEAWVAPANTTQGGPSRIVTLSQDTGNRNWTLGQSDSRYMSRIRTSGGGGGNGIPDLNTGTGIVQTQLQHVVFTRAINGAWTIYVDGAIEAAGNRGGNFSNWNGNYELALVNELTNNRDWLGDLYLVALYDRALDGNEIQQNLIAGPDCIGNLPPSAVCDATRDQCNTPLEVAFDATGSTDPDGQIVGYTWDFGDGNSATGISPNHTYAAAGTYTATVTVTDDEGATSTCSSTVSIISTQGGRINSDLIALYTFTEGSGTTVSDLSGFGAPLDLTIQDPNNVTWNTNGSLTINSGTTISSGVAATKVTNACLASNEITVEAWVAPSNTTQGGPSRIVTLSQNTGSRNWTLGQSGSAYSARLRATGGGGNNGTPDLNTANGLVQTQLQHVVFTRATTGAWILYVDGNVEATGNRGGAFTNWNGNYELALANELTNNRDWLGDMHLVALYDRALNGNEIQQNFAVGPDCIGNLPPSALCSSVNDLCGDPLDFSFDASGSSDPDGQIASYSWDFGDGNSASGISPSHTYAAPGSYAVTLTVTDNDGLASTCTQTVKIVSAQGGRAATGLIALYNFDEGTGNVVTDQSGFGTPLNLTIQDPNNVTWNTNNSLTINSGTMIRSNVPASKIHAACTASNEISVEAWVQPANTSQGGPSRIVTYSVDPFNRNWTMGQSGSRYMSRIRTTGAGAPNGTPDLNTGNGDVQTALQHVVFTRNAAGNWLIYVDGTVQATGIRGGNFSNWDSSYELALVNELTNNRDWLGELHLVAIYDTALSAADILQNYTVGPDCGIPGTNAKLGGGAQAGVADEALVMDVEVYPNPFQNEFTLKMRTETQLDQVTIRVFDLKGQLIEARDVRLDGSVTEADFSLVDYTSGNYVVVVQGAGFSRRLTIVKQ